MSDNNGSILDSIIAGFTLVDAFIVLLTPFLLTPRGVLGYEFSSTLTSNTFTSKIK